MKCLSEDALLDFLGGRLLAEKIAAVDEHLSGCASCRERVALAAGTAFSMTAAGSAVVPVVATTAQRAVAPALLQRGMPVGRYIIIDLVGRGGMGDVYAAFDPELNRKVALKLIKGDAERSDDDARKRLLREAKAAARLSHANVVVVHDAGTIDDRVFVAMEFIEGQTLQAWVRAAPRSRREIVEAFLAAGRGLAAAHAAGLVHRDFKPHNVMVANDGTVRVMDFGLASERGGDIGQSSAVRRPPVLSASVSADFAGLQSTAAVAMTRTGMLLGTPAYMAPEQFRAERADARSDQFSFCVALYEALYGERPFDGETVGQLSAAVLAGRVREAPARARVPKALRRILLRGLHTDRAQRFPSMTALLVELGRDPARQRRRLTIGAAIALALVVVGVGLQRTLERPEAQCRRTSEHLTEVWEAAGAPGGTLHRDAVHAAFVAAGGPNVAATWQRVSGTLDRYARDWVRMSTESCEATRVSGEQSSEVLDLRTTCLGTTLQSLRALTVVFATADRGVVDEAVNAANALPDLARCADVTALKAVTPPPRDPQTRDKVERLRKRLVEIRALRDAGKVSVTLTPARALVEDARAVAYDPLLAESLELDCWLETQSGWQARAMVACEQAVWAAEASRDDEVGAPAAIQLIAITAGLATGTDVQDRWMQLAKAILKRMGPGHERLEGWLENDLGHAALEHGDGKTAVEHCERSIALETAALGGDHPDLALSLNNYANALQEIGESQRGLEAERRAIVIVDKAYGHDNRLVGILMSNEGEMLNALSREKEALPIFQGALDIFGAEDGANRNMLAFPLTGLGRALLGLGRAKESVGPLEHALAIRDRDETLPMPRGETRFALARALWESGGDRARARALAISARDEYQRATKAAKELAAVDAWLTAHRATR